MVLFFATISDDVSNLISYFYGKEHLRVALCTIEKRLISFQITLLIKEQGFRYIHAEYGLVNNTCG